MVGAELAQDLIASSLDVSAHAGLRYRWENLCDQFASSAMCEVPVICMGTA